MQPGGNGSVSGSGASSTSAVPRMASGGLSFREVGDWFKNLGDDLGGLMGLPRSRSVRRPGPGGGPLASGDSQLGGVPRLPSTSILAKQQQIVVGMLLKYVNIGSGWRHRLFVLRDGVLRYYKVYGPTAINVHQLLDQLREQGELFLIGAEVSLLESRDERMAESSGGSLGGQASSPRHRARLPQPAAEIHLQVASLRESNADYRKFYVHSGTSTLTLRAESKEDRWVWMQALQTSKGSWEGVTPAEASALKRDGAERIVTQDEAFMTHLQEVKAKLAAAGVPGDMQLYVQDLLIQEHQRYHEVLVAEENKRKALLDIVYGLENEKRQLETALVVEGQQGAGLKRSISSAASDSEEQLAEYERQESGVVGGGDDEEEMSSDGEDEFYECESGSITTAHSRGVSVDLTGFASLEHAGSAAAAAGAAGASAAAPGSGTPGMRRTGSKTSLPAPDSTASSPARTPLAATLAVPAIIADAIATKAGIKKEEPGWIAKEGPPPQRRTRMPRPQQQEKSVSLWSLIKDMVGKDLTRVCLPVYFNEPLSALQKTAEDLEYSELLDQAAEFPAGSVERLLRLAAFAVSPYSSTPGRTAKPFNPLLGETFEFVCPEKGFRFLAEKVVHHPTVIAAVAEGRRWRFEGDADVKSKFWGRSIELRPEGLLRVTFSDGDVYQWNKVTTSINNLILGRIYIDHGGIMKVRCVNTGLTARMRFKEAGLIFDKDPRQVRGFLEQGHNRFERPLLHGHWDSEMYADMPDGSTVLLWRKNPPPPEPTRYNLTSFSIMLNELTPGLDAKVAPTDCRLRPDQHCLELGQYDQANNEKQRLEHKQRAARKAAERGDPIRPRWFDFVDPAQSSFNAGKDAHVHGHRKPGEELVFKYKGGYWEARETGDWTGCRDIFGPNVIEPSHSHKE